MKRGEIYWINLEPARPPEFGKIRPCLIVSNTAQNAILDTVVVIPLSTLPPEIPSLRIRLQLSGGKNSFAVLPGIRQVSKTRLHGLLTTATPPDLAAVENALRVYLEL